MYTLTNNWHVRTNICRCMDGGILMITKFIQNILRNSSTFLTPYILVTIEIEFGQLLIFTKQNTILLFFLYPYMLFSAGMLFVYSFILPNSYFSCCWHNLYNITRCSPAQYRGKLNFHHPKSTVRWVYTKLMWPNWNFSAISSLRTAYIIMAPDAKEEVLPLVCQPSFSPIELYNNILYMCTVQ